MKTEISVAIAALILIASAIGGCTSAQKPSNWNPQPIQPWYSTRAEIDAAHKKDEAEGKSSWVGYMYSFGSWSVERLGGSQRGHHKLIARLWGTPKTGVNSLNPPIITIVRELTNEGSVIYNTDIHMGFIGHPTIIFTKDPRGIYADRMGAECAVGGESVRMKRIVCDNYGHQNGRELTSIDQIALPFLLEHTKNVVVAQAIPSSLSHSAFNEIVVFSTAGFDEMMKAFPELWPSTAEVNQYKSAMVMDALKNQLAGNKTESWKDKFIYGSTTSNKIEPPAGTIGGLVVGDPSRRITGYTSDGMMCAIQRGCINGKYYDCGDPEYKKLNKIKIAKWVEEERKKHEAVIEWQHTCMDFRWDKKYMKERWPIQYWFKWYFRDRPEEL